MQDKSFFRPTDILASYADAGKGMEELGRTTNINAFVVFEEILECHDC